MEKGSTYLFFLYLALAANHQSPKTKLHCDIFFKTNYRLVEKAETLLNKQI